MDIMGHEKWGILGCQVYKAIQDPPFSLLNGSLLIKVMEFL